MSTLYFTFLAVVVFLIITLAGTNQASIITGLLGLQPGMKVLDTGRAPHKHHNQRGTDVL